MGAIKGISGLTFTLILNMAKTGILVILLLYAQKAIKYGLKEGFASLISNNVARQMLHIARHTRTLHLTRHKCRRPEFCSVKNWETPLFKTVQMS